MCQSSSANDELMRVIVYEGVSGVGDKRAGDQRASDPATKILIRSVTTLYPMQSSVIKARPSSQQYYVSKPDPLNLHFFDLH